MMDDNKAITKYVHAGDVLYPIRDLKITITIDVETMRRASQAVEEARRVLAGHAVRVAPWRRPDERNIIDQE
jgi:hypothetical protein